MGQQYRLQRSELSAQSFEDRRAIFLVWLGSDAACLQHERADALSRGRNQLADVAARPFEQNRDKQQYHRSLPASDRCRNQRDTASASYRWTPTEAWDVRADYSHMDRNGTQPAGVVGFAPAGGSVFSSPTQVPAPVDDTTQNFGANGEYAGISPWNQKFTVKLAYNGSRYTDNISSYPVQNPYCTGATAATCSTATLSPFARRVDAAEQLRQRRQRNGGGHLPRQSRTSAPSTIR